MINKLPIIGWAISFLANASLSVPFWFCWTVCGIGKTYFYWIPQVYQSIPFGDCVSLFVVLSILKGLVPRVISIEQNNENKNKNGKE